MSRFPMRTSEEQSDKWFTKDSELTKFFERAPLVGYPVALIHTLHGNKDQAIRAVAVCTNATIVGAGILIGTCSLGFVGAFIVTVVTTSIGIRVEVEIINKWVKDPNLRAQCEHTPKRYVYETLRNLVALGMGMYASKWLGSLAPKGVDTVVASILKKIGFRIAFWAEGPVYGMTKLIVDRLKAHGGDVLIWIKERIDELWGRGKAKLSVMEFGGVKIKCT